MTSQNQFGNHHYDPYDPDLGSSSSYHQMHGVFSSIQSVGERMSRSADLVQAPAVELEQGSESIHTRHLMDLLGTPNDTNHQAQRLSLSLGSCVLVPSIQYGQRSLNSDLVGPIYSISGGGAREACNAGVEHGSDEYSFTHSAFPSSSTLLNRTCSTSYGTELSAATLGKSRYLKPAQSLLEEAVSVGGNTIDLSNDKNVARLSHCRRKGALGVYSELKAELCNSGFLSAEKHELQIKIFKLIALLEEVDSRFEEYCHQMEEAVSSFEAIAGSGAAKSYTALALQAMSRHFCNLRDAIISRINLTRRKVSKNLPKISTGLSRLSLFDQETGQNRTSLQQLGTIQNQRQAWRPIRGLPETSVAILRSWLFERFLHPYPNDSEKLMLASQTGLTKNQVSNWFINARVRLWKPMIEEMYKEEFAESDPLFASSSMTRESITDHSDE